MLCEACSKLREKSDEGHWVGYSLDSQGHCVYWPGKCHVMVEQNVTFDITVLIQQDVMAEGEQDAPGIGQNPTPTPTAPSPDTSSPDLLQGFEPEAEGCGHCIQEPSAYVFEIQESQGVSSTHRNDPALPHRLQQPSHTPHGPHHATMAIIEDGMDNEQPPIEYAMIAAAHAMGRDPISISNAKKCEDWPEWDVAIQHGLAQHEQVGTWRLVKPPKDANIVSSHFIFHYKHSSDGNIASRKARLVVQGFTQEEGIDYQETFSPTAKLSAICIITAIATWNDWELEQTDIDGAYLNVPLSETIYMHQPKGYEVPGKEQHVCLLQCALYGLKQAR